MSRPAGNSSGALTREGKSGSASHAVTFLASASLVAGFSFLVLTRFFVAVLRADFFAAAFLLTLFLPVFFAAILISLMSFRRRAFPVGYRSSSQSRQFINKTAGAAGASFSR